jgi:glycerol uptake facilitator-like aquaporin
MKQYLVEIIGIFFLTLAIALTNPIAIGFMLIALVYIGAHVSGAHYNPAISVAAYINDELKFDEMLKYIGAQIFGALLGAYLFKMHSGSIFMLDMPEEASMGSAILLEALLTGLFCWAVLTATLSSSLKSTHLSGVVAGVTLAAIVSIGGIFNPAVAFGGLLCSIFQGAGMMSRNGILVYLVAPFAGAILAGYAHPYFNKK